ncbi:MAG: hypothetical protein RLW42_24805, partial [Gammaproteobacteria bacterium]
GFTVLALVVTLAGAALLGAALASRRPAAAQAVHDARVLAAARDALVGYAVAYPERVNPAHGPGYLPCPAPDARGIAGPACALATGTTLGRFPWHTLRVNDLRDSSGAGLWYALAESHRNNPKHEPLNAWTRASLAHGGEAIVAALIAPGASLAGQHRGAGGAGSSGDYVEHYLVDAGARGALSTRSASNDRVLLLDATMLHRAIGQRALSSMTRVLERYTARHGRLPWLVPPAAPFPSGAQVGVRGGWLAVHPDPGHASAQALVYESDVTLSWKLLGARLSGHGDAALAATACIDRLPCETGPDGPLRGRAECTWWQHADSLRPPADHARCTVFAQHVAGAVRYAYVITMQVVADGPAQVVDPDEGRLRTRTLRVTRLAASGAGAPVFSVAVDITGPSARTARLTATLDTHTHGELLVADLAYALDVAAGEIPAWIVANDWHRVIALAHAACDAHQPCLALRRTPPGRSAFARDDARALLVAAPPGSRNRRALALDGTSFVDAPAAPDFVDRALVVALP